MKIVLYLYLRSPTSTLQTDKWTDRDMARRTYGLTDRQTDRHDLVWNCLINDSIKISTTLNIGLLVTQLDF